MFSHLPLPPINFQRPEVLIHGHLPLPLCGINPRTINGTGWWNKKRKEAYQANNYRCWCCTDHTSQLEQPLQAHEAYVISYRYRVMRLQEIQALCWKCHMFIHSNVLVRELAENKISREQYMEVLLRGQGILKRNNLEMFWYNKVLLLELSGMDRKAAYHAIKCTSKFNINEKDLQDPDWRLILGRRRYYRGEDGEITYDKS